MGAVSPLQHTRSLPHVARELLRNWLLLFLSKTLSVGIFITKGRNSEELLISGQPFAPGRDMDTGKWHPASCE